MELFVLCTRMPRLYAGTAGLALAENREFSGGRGGDQDIRIPIATVSRKQFTLRPEQGSWVLKNVGRGTLRFEGRALEPNEEVPLLAGKTWDVGPEVQFMLTADPTRGVLISES